MATRLLLYIQPMKSCPVDNVFKKGQVMRFRKFEENRSNLDENRPKRVAMADTKMTTF